VPGYFCCGSATAYCCSFIVRFFPGFKMSLEGLAQLVAAGAGNLILVGLATPIAAAVGAVTVLCIAAPIETHIVLATIGVSLALLGPGAWSIDARLYGRRRIDLDSL
jgi:uncharacterized membrane protein YphA (DoxX/SURF4 family)